MTEIPKKLDSIISINFDSLIDIIKILQNKNDILNDRISDLTTRLNTFTDFREDIDNLKYKTDSTLSKLSETQNSLDNFSAKLLDVDNKLLEIASKVDNANENKSSNELNLKTLEEKYLAHENNINNLNRVVEENIKTTDKEKESSIKTNEELLSINARLIKSEEEIRIMRSNNVENIKRLEMMFDSIDVTSKEQENKLSKKVNENEKRISIVTDRVNQIPSLERIMQQVSDSSKQLNVFKDIPENKSSIERQLIEVKEAETDEQQQENASLKDYEKKQSKESREYGTISQSSPKRTCEVLSDINLNRITDISKEISRMQSLIESLKMENYSIKKTMDSEINEMNKKIISLRNAIGNNSHDIMPLEDIHSYQPQSTIPTQITIPIIQETHFQSSSPENILDNNDHKLSMENNKERQVIETLRMLTLALEAKASKEDVNSSNQHINKELDSLTTKLNESLRQIDQKIKLIANITKGSGQSIDTEQLTYQLNNQIEQVITTTAKDVIQNKISEIDLSQNEIFNQAINTLQNHTEELNRTYESIVDIRTNLLALTEEDKTAPLKGQITDLEAIVRKIKFDFENILKNLDDDGGNTQPNKDSDNGSKLLNNQVSVRETINILTTKLITVNDKVDKLEKKQTEIHKNILLIVKQDLKNESSRILEEFKTDLKISITKIEDQMREKVDKFNLLEFSQKMDIKLNGEIKRKLDRTDMTKNNCVINRKIDSLEDKISRQLVDTLIDLQLEEAPLMVKKSINMTNMKAIDKCASCNQNLPQKNPYVTMSTDGNSYGKYKQNKYALKDKLPDINS